VIITPQLVVDQVATSLSDPKSPLGPVKQMRLTDLMILDHITNGDSQLSDNEYSDISMFLRLIRLPSSAWERQTSIRNVQTILKYVVSALLGAHNMHASVSSYISSTQLIPDIN
jgi:hypothetical protein